VAHLSGHVYKHARRATKEIPWANTQYFGGL
jgi:hypothetical protein